MGVKYCISVYFFTLWVFLAGVSSNPTEKTLDLTGLVNCSSEVSLLSTQQRCMDVYNIPITIPGPDELKNATQAVNNMLGQMDKGATNYICSHQEDYLKASTCSININKHCLKDSLPALLNMIPTQAELQTQLAFTCKPEYRDFNRTCVSKFMAEIQKCANVSGLASGAVAANPNVSDAIMSGFCAGYEATRICAERILDPCGDTTKTLYLTNMPQRKACDNYTDSTNNVAPSYNMDAVVCTSAWGIRGSFQRCFSKYDLPVDIPELDTADQIGDYLLDAMTLSENTAVCRNLTAYQSAINCSLAVQRECTEEDLRPTVADGDRVSAGFASLCQRLNDFETDCVINSTRSVCQGRRRRSVQSQSILKHICQDLPEHHKCLVNSLDQCSTATVQINTDILASRVPEMCDGALTKGDNSAQTDSSAFRPVLSIVLVLSMFIFVWCF